MVRCHVGTARLVAAIPPAVTTLGVVGDCQVEEKISKDQRKYFLMEQLKSIKKELGLEKVK
eukprot:1169416-Pyramimonas_sp.AAC.1